MAYGDILRVGGIEVEQRIAETRRVVVRVPFDRKAVMRAMPSMAGSPRSITMTSQLSVSPRCRPSRPLVTSRTR